MPSALPDREAEEFLEGWCHPFAAALNRLYHDGLLPDVEAIAERGILTPLRERHPAPGDRRAGETDEDGFRMR